MRRFTVAFAAVALPLLANPTFDVQTVTGMDTMLSLLANALLVLAVLEYSRHPRTSNAVLVGASGFLAVLARPDNLLCALGVPLLAWLVLPAFRRRSHLAGLLALPAILIMAELFFCQWYFGSALPLSFYAKVTGLYSGFQNSQSALGFFFNATPSALPFLSVAVVTAGPMRVRKMAVFLLPVALTFLYLLTVRQIMGYMGRYYTPFLPYLIVPAVLSADEALADGARRPGMRIAFAVPAALILFAATLPLQHIATRALLRSLIPPPVPVPTLLTKATVPLPEIPWFTQIETLEDEVIRPLPDGAVIAASEVGFIGAGSLHTQVIDLVGLNDTQIALHGFSMPDLLARSPDLIWFPHLDYTGLRATMFSDPQLLQRYVVIAGAFNYGLAIRRDSPVRPQIERGVRRAWARLYPGLGYDDYLASGLAPQRGDGSSGYARPVATGNVTLPRE
jgi:hypothetical protein